MSRRRWRDTVVYELHVKGMTALHDRVPEHLRGTYAGLATPAVTDYLKEGQIVKVKVLETDEKGRVKLSMKALLDRNGGGEQAQQQQQ